MKKKFMYTRIYLYSLLFLIHTNAVSMIFFKRKKSILLPKNKQITHTHTNALILIKEKENGEKNKV